MERRPAHCVAVFYAFRAMALLLRLPLMVSNCRYLSRSHVPRAEFRHIYHSLYIVPGSSAPLKRICLGEHNLLLIYDDQRARLWDTKTKQLWRSMGREKAEELITQGRWSNLYVVYLIGFKLSEASFLTLMKNTWERYMPSRDFLGTCCRFFWGARCRYDYFYYSLAQNWWIFY